MDVVLCRRPVALVQTMVVGVSLPRIRVTKGLSSLQERFVVRRLASRKQDSLAQGQIRCLSLTPVTAFPRRKIAGPPVVNIVSDDIKGALVGTRLEGVEDFRYLYRLLYPGDVPQNYQDLVSIEAVKDELRYLFPSTLAKPKYEPIAKRVPLEQLSKDCIELDPMFRPTSTAHFTGNPKFFDTFVTFEDVLSLLNHRIGGSRITEENQANRPSPRWLPHKEMELKLGEAFSEALYNDLVGIMTEIYFHPLFGELGQQTLKPFMTQLVEKQKRETTVKVQKTAVARVWVWPEERGTPNIRVNGHLIGDYFRNTDKRLLAIEPLHRFNLIAEFSAMCNVYGGGVTGQAGAISLGIAKALVMLRPELKPELDRAELLVRDSRNVEPKKPGQKKARKKFQWVKR
eukprot:gene3254-5959_t